MDRATFNTFCSAMPATSHVVQWGNADVWKVGPKVFAICGWADGRDAFTFKVSEIAYEVLRDLPGVRPAPYLASRGMKWLQHYGHAGSVRCRVAATYRDLLRSGRCRSVEEETPGTGHSRAKPSLGYKSRGV